MAKAIRGLVVACLLGGLLVDVSSQEETSRVLSLQHSGKPSAESYARLSTIFQELQNFTMCYRLRLGRFREESTLLSYAISDDRDNEFRIVPRVEVVGGGDAYFDRVSTVNITYHREGGYRVSLQGHWATSTLATPLRSWATFCFTYTLPSSTWGIYLDGEQKASGIFSTPTEPLMPGGAFIIGQEQDALGGLFQRDQSFSGELTDLNIWGSVLSKNAIQQVASCDGNNSGDKLSWPGSTWKLNGEAEWINSQPNQTCQHSTKTINIFPDRFSLSQAIDLCQVVGANILVPENARENTWVYEKTHNKSIKCSGGVGESYLWLGATDSSNEGVWTNLATKMEVSWSVPWRGDGPNGGTEENCLVMLTGQNPGRWSDIACLDSYSFCVPCESRRPATIYLKGPAVCQYSPFNRQYQLGRERQGKPSLEGFFHSDIYWSDGVWRIQSLKVNASAWHNPVKEGLYPFGRHVWTLDGEVCGMKGGSVVNLTLSVCGQGQFTCEDGKCIDLDQRCDLRIDCDDQSDEAQCSLVDIPSGYRTIIPPPPINTSSPLPIYFIIDIIAFPTIATQDQTFTATLSLSLRWQDTRLNFLNLKQDRTLNLLSPNDVRNVWTPRVFFTNAHGNMFTNLAQGARVECVRGGPSIPGPADLPQEVNVFPGNETSLEMSQLYSATYTCDFHLAMFPFDSQVCYLRFTLVSAAASYMVLLPKEAIYTGNTFLIEYLIGKLEMEVQKGHEFSTLQVYVKFSRRYTFYIVTFYIPTVLLILIAYATFYFNPDDFNSRVVVAVTSLLVLTSLLTQTSNSLPKTSYFKLIDVWLFVSIVVIFLVILLQTLVNFTQSPTGSSSWLNSILKWSTNRRKPSHPVLTSVRPYQDDLIIPHIHTNSHKKSQEEEDVEGKRKRKKRMDMDGVGRKLRGQDVNMSLMVKSRILIPLIYLLFNLIYWTIVLSQI